MTKMCDFEIRANNIITAISASQNRIEQFGYNDDPTCESISRIYGMFVTWLTACEEARHQLITPNATFSVNVINKLPLADDSSWEKYIEPPPTSTLRQRIEALWGIRIAFTHGDGETKCISSEINKSYALNAVNYLPGVKLNGSRIYLDGGITHSAIRTIVQLRDVLP